MFKKIAAAAALAATASFATWDFYPVQEAGKGSAEAGLYYDWHDDWSHAGIKVGARYAVISNLELSLQGWGYQFWSEVDCDHCRNGGDGLRDLTIGAKYQLAPIANAFLDVILPLGGDEVTSDEFALYMGGQFSMPTGVQGLVFGTEAGLFWGFEHDHNERGLELHLGGELGYNIPSVPGLMPYVGLQIKFKVTENTWTWEECQYDAEEKENVCKEVEGGDNSDGDSQIILWAGAAYAITPQISLKGQLILRNGDHDEMGGDATGFYVAADFNF